MNFTYEVKHDSVDFLFEDGSLFSIKVDLGPGYWYRVISKLRKLGKAVNPEDFHRNIQYLYYYHSREELRGKPEKQKELGFFTCPQCDLIYSSYGFEHQNPCDNCRYFTD